MINSNQFSRARRGRASFTLVELLLTISIIGMMAGMILFAFSSAEQTAREARTKAIIAKLDSIIKAKWDAYRTRRVPIDMGMDRFFDANLNGMYDGPPNEWLTFDLNGNGQLDPLPQPPAYTSPMGMAKRRIDALHDLMRMELPDTWRDVDDNFVMADNPAHHGPLPTNGLARPAVSQGYLRKYTAAYNAALATKTAAQAKLDLENNQNAECLYQIVASGISEDGGGLEMFSQGDIGDTDGDGMPEFLDGWKRPIRFLRWAPGFFSELNVVVYGQVQSFARGRPTDTFGPHPSTLIATNDQDKASLTPNPISLFSQNQTAYGNMALYLTGTMDGYSAKIQTYLPNAPGPGTVQFSFNYDPNYTTYPFGGNDPTPGETFVLLAQDPFDPLDVYGTPTYTQFYPVGNQSAPFALYPLIYSAGPDGVYGIKSASTAFAYGDQNINAYPFIVDSSDKMPIGSPADFPKEPNFRPNGWLDNIHNHMLNPK